MRNKRLVQNTEVQTTSHGFAFETEVRTLLDPGLAGYGRTQLDFQAVLCVIPQLSEFVVTDLRRGLIVGLKELSLNEALHDKQTMVHLRHVFFFPYGVPLGGRD